MGYSWSSHRLHSLFKLHFGTYPEQKLQHTHSGTILIFRLHLNAYKIPGSHHQTVRLDRGVVNQYLLLHLQGRQPLQILDLHVEGGLQAALGVHGPKVRGYHDQREALFWCWGKGLRNLEVDTRSIDWQCCPAIEFVFYGTMRTCHLYFLVTKGNWCHSGEINVWQWMHQRVLFHSFYVKIMQSKM